MPGFRLRPPIEVLDRRDLKPKSGDVVRYEGEEYVVTEVGMRYVHMYRRSDQTKSNHVAKIQMVTKTHENVLKDKTPVPPSTTPKKNV